MIRPPKPRRNPWRSADAQQQVSTHPRQFFTCREKRVLAARLYGTKLWRHSRTDGRVYDEALGNKQPRLQLYPTRQPTARSRERSFKFVQMRPAIRAVSHVIVCLYVPGTWPKTREFWGFIYIRRANLSTRLWEGIDLEKDKAFIHTYHFM